MTGGTELEFGFGSGFGLLLEGAGLTGLLGLNVAEVGLVNGAGGISGLTGG